MTTFRAAAAAAVFAAAGALPTYAVDRCDVDRSEYPLQHTMPDGKTVTLVWAANQCGPESRGIWVKMKTDGRTCGLGYRCERRHRGR